MEIKSKFFIAGGIFLIFFILILPFISAPTFNKGTYSFVTYTNHSIYWASPTQATANTLGGGTNSSAQNYTNLQTIDNNNATISSDATNDGVYFRINITVDVPISSINWTNIVINGGENATEGARLYIYNFTSATWINQTFLSTTDGNISVNYTTTYQMSNVISPNKQIVLYIKGENFDGVDFLKIDYVQAEVGFTDNNPQWSSNSTNSTKAGAFILHSVNLTDQINLSGYIFSFNNGSGTFSNDSFVTLTTPENWSNVSKWVNTTGNSSIQWYVWFNDTANQVNSTALFNYTDANPKWSQNTTNGTTAGAFILHSVNWTDDNDLSGYIFSFDNGTGSQVNDSFVVFSGTQNWSNVSKWVSTTGGATIIWRVYANDSANSLNSTSNFTYTTTTACWTYNAGSKLLIIPSGCLYSLSSGTIQGI